MIIRALTVATLSLAFLGEVSAQEWTRFRGPNGTGVVDLEGLPSEIGPEHDPVWRVEVPPGYSSPIVTKQGIVITANEGLDLLTICLDPNTGERLWTAKCPEPLEKAPRGPNSPVAPSPASDGENVYVFFDHFGLLSFDAKGELRWQMKLGPFNNPYGMGASPVVVGSRVILLCDQDTNSYLLAVDKDSGKELWKTDRPGATHGFASPVVYQPKEGPAQILVSGSYAVTAYAADTGERVWWVDGLAWQAKCLPIVHDDVVYVSSWMAGVNELGVKANLDMSFEDLIENHDKDGDGAISKAEAPDPAMPQLWFLYDLGKDGTLDAEDWRYVVARIQAKNGLYAIRLGGKGNVKDSHVLWSYDRSLPNIPSPLFYDGLLYVLKEGGILASLDPKTGDEVKKGRVEATDSFFASPVAGDGKIYFVSQSGMASVVEAGQDWKVLSTSQFENDKEEGEEIWSTPALAHGRIYVRTQKAIYAFGQPADKGGPR
ncbi:MAG: PQQ-binding-like beta-propeller repeat protein [Planctomycetota bacterium]